ncbi:RNA polymerase sigma factor, partial [Nostocoides japonicum]|uniref:RNA polymerase sigma factor n=1 Tax=Nostocoides japonicum TaxID=99481 RepID=UPI0009F87941
MPVSLPPFQRLVDAHWRDVARLAHALAGPVDGDDVAQQAWVQALAAYPSLRSATNPRGWLLTITHRCAMDVHRRRARSAVPTAEPADLGAAPVVAGPEGSTPDAALWARVAALPERQ